MIYDITIELFTLMVYFVIMIIIGIWIGMIIEYSIIKYKNTVKTKIALEKSSYDEYDKRIAKALMDSMINPDTVKIDKIIKIMLNDNSADYRKILDVKEVLMKNNGE